MFLKKVLLGGGSLEITGRGRGKMKIFQCTNFFQLTCLHDFFFGLSMNSFFGATAGRFFFFRQVSLACSYLPNHLPPFLIKMNAS